MKQLISLSVFIFLALSFSDVRAQNKTSACPTSVWPSQADDICKNVATAVNQDATLTPEEIAQQKKDADAEDKAKDKEKIEADKKAAEVKKSDADFSKSFLDAYNEKFLKNKLANLDRLKAREDKISASKSMTDDQKKDAIAKLDDSIKTLQDQVDALQSKQGAVLNLAEIKDKCGGVLGFVGWDKPKFTEKGLKQVGTYHSAEDAQTAKEQYESNPKYSLCQIGAPNSPDFDSAKKKTDTEKQEPTIVKLDKLNIGGSGDVFKDNSSKLAGDVDISELKDYLGVTVNDKGQRVKRELVKMNVYTCASMYRNCSPMSKNGGDACPELNQQRKDNGGSDLGGKSLWLDLSEQRNQSVRDQLTSELKNIPGADQYSFNDKDDGAKGYPDSAMSNYYKIGYNKTKESGNADLAGTCGPLPKQPDSYWGKKCDQSNPKDPVRPVASQCKTTDRPVPIKTSCDKLEEYYGSDSTKKKMKDYLNSVGTTDLNKSADYKAFRYYKVVPEVKETVLPYEDKDLKDKTTFDQKFSTWTLSCKEIVYTCKGVEIDFPSFDFSSGPSAHHGSKCTNCCPSF